MRHSKQFHWVLISAALALPPMAAHGSFIQFTLSNPEKVVFDYDDLELLDDYVHLTTTDGQVPVDAGAGDTIVWDYNYAKHFRVNSDDKADISRLKLFARGDGDGDVDVSFWLTDAAGEKIPTTVLTWTGLVWKANKNVLLFDDWPSPNGDDKLGVLKDLVVGDFHLEIKVNSGSVAFAGGSFDWEVGDITAIPEPQAITLASLGLAAIGLLRRGRGRRP